MDEQPDLFTIPVPLAPSRGKTIRSREASRSGARSQTVTIWTEKRSALLQMLQAAGPSTRNELATLLHWPLSSVCSVLDALIHAGAVISNGDYSIQEFDGRTTKRERFRMR